MSDAKKEMWISNYKVGGDENCGQHCYVSCMGSGVHNEVKYIRADVVDALRVERDEAQIELAKKIDACARLERENESIDDDNMALEKTVKGQGYDIRALIKDNNALREALGNRAI